MTLFITKGGQQLGPYSLDQVQSLVANGTLVASDWAWYEGAPNWIQLSQVPGFVLPVTAYAAVDQPDLPSRAERPVLVWIICLFYFICFPFGVLGVVMIYLIGCGAISIHMPEAQQHFYASQNIFDYGLTAASLALNLTWAILLFRLKRQALYFYLGCIALGIVAITYNVMSKNWIEVVGTMGLITVSVTWILNFLLLGYIWHLTRKGVLR